MDIDRLKQRLNSFTSKNSVNTDTFLKLGILSNERLLPIDDINRVVNLSDQFELERNTSTFYRVIGTLNPVVSNPLFNLTDSVHSNNFTWSAFNNLSFLDTSYPKDSDVADKTDLTYTLAIDKFLKEKEGWFGYYDPDKSKTGFCNYFDMEPKRERFSFIPDIVNSNIIKNWELTITYPCASDSTHYMVNNGLIIIDKQTVSLSNREMTAFGMPCKHNLSIGDVVRITGTTNHNGDYVVVRTGLDNGDLKDYYFVIDVSPAGSINQDSRIKKLVNGTESNYYFRMFKKIKTKQSSVIETDDYETYKLAFSDNVYSDNIIQFSFNEDIDVNELVDNLGRPLSELYLSIVKTNSSGIFSDISSGIEVPFIKNLTNNIKSPYLTNIPVISRIHHGGTKPFTSHSPLENSIHIIDNVFYGDLVEYNQNTLLETVLSDVYHRFNTVNREAINQLNAINTLQSKPIPPTTLITKSIILGPRQEGYYYKAHHLIKIRDFSSYIETGTITTVGVPSYAVNLGDGRVVWRDLLDLGFSDTTNEPLNYPFLNGAHYRYNNYNFFVKRQDPFGFWGLYYGDFPADPFGSVITDKFITNSEEDVC